MAHVMGFRQVKVFNIPAGKFTEIDRQGAYGYLEVTNNADTAITFSVNDFTESGHSPVSIPIAPKSTRVIPLTTYNFTASGDVTVVAYGR